MMRRFPVAVRLGLLSGDSLPIHPPRGVPELHPTMRWRVSGCFTSGA